MFKKILLLILFLYPSFGISQTFVFVDRVVDGDTFEIVVSEHPPSLQKIKVRLLGIDTPESFRPRCSKEKIKALEVKSKLKELIEKQWVRLENVKFDKYGSRILAEVFLKDVSINKLLISNNLAKPYFGTGKKFDWCDQKIIDTFNHTL